MMFALSDPGRIREEETSGADSYDSNLHIGKKTTLKAKLLGSREILTQAAPMVHALVV